MYYYLRALHLLAHSCPTLRSSDLLAAVHPRLPDGRAVDGPESVLAALAASEARSQHHPAGAAAARSAQHRLAVRRSLSRRRHDRSGLRRITGTVGLAPHAEIGRAHV